MRRLAEFGIPLQGIHPVDFSPAGIDILPEVPGLDFDAAWERRVEGVIDHATGLTANFVSRDDLIASKLASGRKRDPLDVEDIRAAGESQKPSEPGDSTG